MKEHIIEFKPATSPITKPVTKFGGTPVWVGEPQWPLAKESGEPMQFIGQIALDVLGFQGAMAYLFMAEDSVYTSDPNGGANAVIVQPSTAPLPVEVKALTEGPLLYERVAVPGEPGRRKEEREFAVSLQEREAEEPEEFDYDSEEDDEDGEEELADDEEEDEDSEEADDEEEEAGFTNKIGGYGEWLQADDTPKDGEWLLLLQLDSQGVPFYVDFGDAGVGYAFLSGDGQRGKFLWQCG